MLLTPTCCHHPPFPPPLPPPAPGCRYKVNDLTINGETKALSTTGYPTFQAAAFKYTNVRLSEVDGAVFCFNAYHECRELDVLALNGRLQFSVFNKDHRWGRAGSGGACVAGGGGGWGGCSRRTEKPGCVRLTIRVHWL